jgi:hypothetical protein
MSGPRKFAGLNITRSVQDRIFLGLMGLIFMPLTGYVLYVRYTEGTPADAGLVEKMVRIVIDEVVLIIFLLAVCAYIWGVTAPRWVERFFTTLLAKFLLVLGLISLLLFGVMICVFRSGL